MLVKAIDIPITHDRHESVNAKGSHLISAVTLHIIAAIDNQLLQYDLIWFFMLVCFSS